MERKRSRSFMAPLFSVFHRSGWMQRPVSSNSILFAKKSDCQQYFPYVVYITVGIVGG